MLEVGDAWLLLEDIHRLSPEQLRLQPEVVEAAREQLTRKVLDGIDRGSISESLHLANQRRLRTWIKTIGTNALRDQEKSDKRRLQRQQKFWQAYSIKRLDIIMSDYRHSPERVVILFEETREILARIDALPKHLRGVAREAYLGYTAQEIADEFGIPLRTVYNRLEAIQSPKIKAALLAAA
jgi:hypothetical protein